MTRNRRTSRTLSLIVAIGLMGMVPSVGLARQTSGSTGTAVAGAALGAYSGAVLGVAGSMVPCTESAYGATCVRFSSILSGAVGTLGGTLTGARDSERLQNAAVSAGIGVLAGGTVGLMLKPFAQRVGWEDVAALGLFGGAIGAQPLGSAIGFGAGAVVGVVLWRTVPGFHFPEFIGVASAGMAIGGLVAWLEDGVSAQSNADPIPVTVMRFRF